MAMTAPSYGYLTGRAASGAQNTGQVDARGYTDESQVPNYAYNFNVNKLSGSDAMAGAKVTTMGVRDKALPTDSLASSNAE